MQRLNLKIVRFPFIACLFKYKDNEANSFGLDFNSESNGKM